ncbi:MAG: hypothetical protein J5441_04490 [Clostridia bacterium]|jgi:hypothetical protein|nr:hypothetical protein [Clostridia bacterium]
MGPKNVIGYIALGMGLCVIFLTLLPSAVTVTVMACLLFLCGLFSLYC